MTPLLSTLLGACVGSFLNVCLHRWKTGGQILSPPSFCPHCHHSIFWFDNIPVLSFIVLGAKCRFCQKTISWQYPIVELITAVLFGVSSVFFHQEWFRVLPSFVFVSFVVILAASDLKWKLLPHVFNNIFILAGMIFTKEGFTFSAFFTSASNFILIGSILYGITQIIPKGLGGGDIKMGAALAIWLGFSNTLLVLFLSFALGSLVMLPLLWMKKVSKKSMIPFGPFLTMAGLFVWFFPELTNQLGVAL